MIDTNNGILDATNLGRTIYSSATEYVYGPDATARANTYYWSGSNIEIPFQGLKNEFRYTIYFQQQLTTDSSDSNFARSGLRARLYAINSGSNAYDTWTLIGPANGITPTPLEINSVATSSNAIHSEDYLESTRRIDVSGSLNAYNGKMLKFVIDFSLFNANSPNVGPYSAVTAKYKHINIIGSRGLIAARAGFDTVFNNPPTA
jgi:hypothetical protein